MARLIHRHDGTLWQIISQPTVFDGAGIERTSIAVFMHDPLQWRQCFPNISGGTSYFIEGFPESLAKAGIAGTLTSNIIHSMQDLATAGKGKSGVAATITLGGPAFIVVNPLGFHTQTYNATSGSAATAQYIIFYPNGTWLVYNSVSGNIVSGNWGNPTTLNIGANYWIRFTRTFLNSSNGGDSSATTGWLNMGNQQSVVATSIDNFFGSHANSIYTVQIATDAAGANIVSTSTIGLNATRTATPATITAPAGLTSHTVLFPANASAGIALRNDGTITFNVNNSHSAITNWHTPTIAGAGNNYYVYAELIGGSGVSSGDPLNTWLPLSSSALNWSNIVTGTGTKQTTIRFYIGDSALNVLSTGVFVIEANVDL